MSDTYDAFATGAGDSFSPTAALFDFFFFFFLYDSFRSLFAAVLPSAFLGLWLPLKYAVVARYERALREGEHLMMHVFVFAASGSCFCGTSLVAV